MARSKTATLEALVRFLLVPSAAWWNQQGPDGALEVMKNQPDVDEGMLAAAQAAWDGRDATTDDDEVEG